MLSNAGKGYIRFIFAVLAVLFITTGEKASAQTSAVASRRTALEDISIHYTANGTGSPVLMFIHGWSCDGTVWRYQTAYFKKSSRVIAIDLPGHGQSGAPIRAYTFDLFADAVKQVLDAENVEQAVLVGHSMGFPVARRFAKKYPAMVQALCIVDGAYFRVPKNPKDRKEWKVQTSEFVKGFSGPGREAYTRQFLDSLYVAQTPEKLKKEIEAKVLSTPEHVACSAMNEMIDPENWHEFSLPIPALAVYAVSPDIPSDNRQYLSKLFPSLEYSLWGDAGHFLMMEQPDRFNRILAGFLKETAGKEPSR